MDFEPRAGAELLCQCVETVKLECFSSFAGNRSFIGFEGPETPLGKGHIDRVDDLWIKVSIDFIQFGRTDSTLGIDNGIKSDVRAQALSERALRDYWLRLEDRFGILIQFLKSCQTKRLIPSIVRRPLPGVATTRSVHQATLLRDASSSVIQLSSIKKNRKPLYPRHWCTV